MPSLFNVLFSTIKKPPHLGWQGECARGPRAKRPDHWFIPKVSVPAHRRPCYELKASGPKLVSRRQVSNPLRPLSDYITPVLHRKDMQLSGRQG